MAVNPMLTAGVNGIQQATRALDSVAQEIADSGRASDSSQDRSLPEPDTRVQDSVDAMADLRLYTRQVQASARVVETADEVLGFLLDVRV